MSKKIVDYIIITKMSPDTKGLEKEVNKAIADGGAPLGSPFEIKTGLNIIAQAVVWYED